MYKSELPTEEGRRYWKFSWLDISALPPIGKMDYLPKKGRLVRLFESGNFFGEYLETFPVIKTKKALTPFRRCIYCGRDKDENGRSLPLTCEHIIPEYLGAGLELPSASCADCQKNTGEFERSIAEDMFDPVRRSFLLKGKNGLLKKMNFPLDLGFETTQYEFISFIHYPTILVLPALYPAASYSRKPKDADDLFNLRLYNINADAARLQKYAIDRFATAHIDMVRFSQLIAKIAHAYAMHYFGVGVFSCLLTDFIRTNYPPGAHAKGYLEHVGCLLHIEERKTTNLHEIEAGKIKWNGKSYFAVRVRLFANCDMPSYYVTVGLPNTP